MGDGGGVWSISCLVLLQILFTCNLKISCCKLGLMTQALPAQEAETRGSQFQGLLEQLSGILSQTASGESERRDGVTEDVVQRRLSRMFEALGSILL